MTTETVLVSTDWDPESPITTTLAGAWSQNWIAGFEGNSTTKIQTAAINDGAVTTAKIATSAVTTAKIATSAVTTAKIATSAVTTEKIATSAVTTAKIANGNVTSAKLATGTGERDWVLGRIAGASVGGVGTYALLNSTSLSGYAPGSTLSGSSLRYSSAGESYLGTPTPSGTWRIVGYKAPNASIDNAVSLWLRIS